MKLRTFLAILCICIVISAMLCGCMEKEEQKVQIKETAKKPNKIKIVDCAGRVVEVPTNVSRVVDLAILDGIRFMVQLQAQDKLVATNQFVKDYMFGEKGKKRGYWFAVNEKRFPELKNLPSVGTYDNPNVELIMSLKPDVILMYRTKGELADTLQKKTGIPVVCIGDGGNFSFKSLRILGKILGKEERAEELINYANKKIEKIESVTSQIPENERQKVLLLFWPFRGLRTTPYYAPLEVAGGINVAAGKTPQKSFGLEITKEQIVEWNPDVIFIHAGSKKPWLKVEDILNDPILKSTKAVKNKRVYYTKGYMIGWDPATGLCEAYYMAKLLYPDKFKDLDVEKECNEILKEFYGYDGMYDELLNHTLLYRWK